MAYFDGIKIGDKVWSFLNGWEEVVDILEKGNIFKTENEYYDYNGYLLDVNFNVISKEQIVFWVEIEFEPLTKLKIKLKEDYSKTLQVAYFTTSKNSFKQAEKYLKLLALRDQECYNSRGYEFTYGVINYFIYFDEAKKE